ncbi:MAG TPA: rhomboid family intramembrane serine protease, partial [Elusimicrobiota bacterium]|nr:rhomboid family intramembrane serine protease [Elusimicrobiota bacterium]
MSPRAFGHGPFDIGRLPPAIKGLVISNIAVFALSQMVRGQFIGIFGLIPAKVTGELWIWQLFTYLFIHAGFMHLLFNLFALGMFGMPIESQWGSREFLRYYLVCGIGGGLFQVLVSPGSAFPILGASGAVFGLLVAFAMLYPDAVVYLYFFFPIKAKHMAILFGVIELLAGTAETTPVVARFTHLGGMLIGYVYLRWGWVLRSRVQQAISGLPPAPESRAK